MAESIGRKWVADQQIEGLPNYTAVHAGLPARVIEQVVELRCFRNVVVERERIEKSVRGGISSVWLNVGVHRNPT